MAERHKSAVAKGSNCRSSELDRFQNLQLAGSPPGNDPTDLSFRDASESLHLLKIGGTIRGNTRTCCSRVFPLDNLVYR
jgi:hypothetical protein